MKLQPAALETWDSKYRLRDGDGNPLESSVSDTFSRVACALASVEKSEAYKRYNRLFYDVLKSGALPAGRIMANAGAGKYKPGTSLINCTVSGTIEDSMDDILRKVHEAGITLKYGCGIGYDFSTLRPRGAKVRGAGAYTNGPIAFMDIYDRMCFTVASAGGRRGAQMATFDVRHPDVFEFIRAKREPGRLRQFNLSLLVHDDLIKAVQADDDYHLRFPVDAEPGEALVERTIKARQLWDEIMLSTYDYGEPGVIFIDRYNDENNLRDWEEIRATNPCGEQGLPPYGACLLGSINLARFVRNPFTDQARFEWEPFKHTVRVFTRMLDNVVELANLPLEQQRSELIAKRRHGMGFLGLGSALALMGVRYGSPESIRFTETVTRTLAFQGWLEGALLAEQKGPAPALITMAQRESFLRSPHMSKVLNKKVVDMIKTNGCRFTHHSSIAPTGTLALSLGNNVSNGIEPTFAHAYKRNVIVPGKKTKEQVDVEAYELLRYREAGFPMGAELPEAFVTADDISPDDHIAIQAAAQKWVDSSISKTVNVPTNYPFDQFKDLYLKAYEKGLKGLATFRYNPETMGNVLVRSNEQSGTMYSFTLADGSTVNLRGDETVEYDGETHVAANLHEALREGYYGRHA